VTEIADVDIATLADEELMSRYGIECVPIVRFHYKDYRYSLLADAVKQAQRDELQP
jgi:hypothetical protein